jgi:hypothetical protein
VHDQRKHHPFGQTKEEENNTVLKHITTIPSSKTMALEA